MANEITMASKFPGKCPDCGFRFPEGTQIKYNRDTKVATHVKCPEPDYSGTEQKNIFDMWIERAKETEVLQEQMKGRRNERR